jgi:hypothetical protein
MKGPSAIRGSAQNAHAAPPRRQGLITRMLAAIGIRPKARAMHHYEDITSLSNAEPALRGLERLDLTKGTLGKLPKGR